MNVFDAFLMRLFQRARALDDSSRYARYRRIHAIHPTFRFNGPGTILTEGEGEIALGENSYIGQGSFLLAERGASIVIGRQTSISHGFVAYTKNVVADEDLNRPPDTWRVRLGDVRIGSGCWIGFRVFVVEGVTIGDNVVVGAHSVVTHDLEAGGIYAGVPARLLRKKNQKT